MSRVGVVVVILGEYSIIELCIRMAIIRYAFRFTQLKVMSMMISELYQVFRCGSAWANKCKSKLDRDEANTERMLRDQSNIHIQTTW